MNKKKSNFLSHFGISGHNDQKEIDQKIIDDIMNNRDKMINYVYEKYSGRIKSMVIGFHSLELNPDDIFQEGLIAAIENIRKNRFKGESSFYTYLYHICQNICNRTLRNSMKRREKEGEMEGIIEIESDNEDLTSNQKEELINIMMRLKIEMDEKCRRIFDLRFGIGKMDSTGLIANLDSEKNIRFKEIAEILNINETNARKRFERCLEQLRQAALSDNEWKSILADLN